MPRPRKPARLYYRPATGLWTIRDGEHEFGTGVSGRGAQQAAEQALAKYIAQRLPSRSGPAQPSEITVGEVLARYITDKGPQMADPERLKYAAKALRTFWAGLTCDAVKGSVCRAYAATRPSSPTARRELGTLQAALNYGHKEGLLIYAPTVTLADHGKPRERWLTRSEAARLLWEARKGRNKTLVRFILIGLYTGTRPGAVLGLRWTPSLDSGWIDLDRGVLHRAGARERQTKKRKGDCRLPRQLLAHMRRWRDRDLVISWNGKPVRDIGKALESAAKRAGVEGVHPHLLKHTAITWAFQRGMTLEDAADYFSTSTATLERVYRQHSPEHQGRAVGIMERR